MIESFFQFHDELASVDNLALSLTLPKIIQYLVKINYCDKINQASTSDQNVLSRATEYIAKHYNGRINVEDIAVHVNMGYEKFRKIFTMHYGISPGNYIIRHRIKHAQSILTSGEHSIKEIALQLGYVDSFTFSKQFKRVTGRTPSEFKELYLK
ncbi:MAG: AraC family transcriptional regulator [Vallitaleaceae bacterium]|jgi:AraC-like DNA-binding protein|nr:AraC family transcriptional regulator [Vallitaleaceae bacterium]